MTVVRVFAEAFEEYRVRTPAFVPAPCRSLGLRGRRRGIGHRQDAAARPAE